LTADKATNAPTIDTSAGDSQTLVAHPPNTANINNVVIDDQTAAREQSE
ncbi:DNA-binding protein, partial [Francisella tularensis subsp. holarctica]|nr:DNA-binding protein [Francisella tularensis subsp. holarctica]